MRRYLFALLGMVFLILVFIAYSFYVSRNLVDAEWNTSNPYVIADPEMALTFARSESSLIRVVRHLGDVVIGVDISDAIGESRDLIEAYNRIGYEGLSNLQGDEIRISVNQLQSPIDFTYPSIAAGANYRDHADEVNLDDPPFLFPKLAQASVWNAPVDDYTRLDYEAELAMVPLSNIEKPGQKVNFGLILCNDFTDRWTLIRQIDLSEPMGITGFTAAKGQATFLPTGYLFVIPKSPEFYKSISLELTVNGVPRQHFQTSDMILNVEEIVSKTFSMAQSDFFDGDRVVSLLPSGSIPRGTLILTGTGGGVAFKPVNIWNQGFYLQPGDQVVTQATYLGQLNNRIK